MIICNSWHVNECSPEEQNFKSVFNITQITFMQFRFSFFLSKDNRHREEDRCTDRKSLQRYVCLWKEPFYLKGLCLATTFPVPPSSNADSSLWSTDQLPPPSSPTTLLQDLPGPTVCCQDPHPLTQDLVAALSILSPGASSARSQRPLPGIPGTPRAQES